jgi:hypothetical protein
MAIHCPRVCTKSSTSPRSGRLTIAQQSTAGMRVREMQSVKRTVEKSRYLALITQPSASRTYVLSPFIPAVNCWATVIRPLSRTERTTFCAKQLPAATRGLFQPKIVFALSPASFAQRVTQHSFSPPLRKRRGGWRERLLARNPTPNPSPFTGRGIQKAEWVFLCKAPLLAKHLMYKRHGNRSFANG